MSEPAADAQRNRCRHPRPPLPPVPLRPRTLDRPRSRGLWSRISRSQSVKNVGFRERRWRLFANACVTATVPHAFPCVEKKKMKEANSVDS